MSETATTIRYYLAICTGCRPILPMPFVTEASRKTWVDGHVITGHTDIALREEVR